MISWDYEVVVIVPGEEIPQVLEKFRALGREGWELATIFNGGDAAIAIFTRELEETGNG